MSTSSSQLIMASCSSQPMDDLTRYMPLHKYILEGDLESVKQLCDSDDHALEARITANWDTALHVAVGTGMADQIVEYLLNKMSQDQVALQNRDGNTVLSIAAIVGNIQAAKLLVKKDENLNRVANNCGWIPLIEAAQHQKKEMTEYLLQFTEGFFESEENVSTDTIRIFFLNFLIGAKFYDLALELVRLHPSLATTVSSDGESLLKAIAGKPSAFPSKIRKPDIWERCSTYIYYYKGIQKATVMYNSALILVKRLCMGITSLDHKRASSLLKEPLLLAAESGVIEVVEEILKTFPDALSFSNEMNHNAFQLAIMNRHDNIFKLIFEMSTAHRNSLLMSKDIRGNNILHLAGKLAPRYKLNLIPGAAMQMQSEIRWFKDVEKIVAPRYKEDKNLEGKTPEMVFSEEHMGLVKEGEQWMKSAATSYSVAAALIATVGFSAAITVPGDYNDYGKPALNGKITFLSFGTTDTISMFSSIASIIMFLSILTSRYTEVDFLYALPMKLIWCLALSLFSVTATLIAFTSAVYLVFYGDVDNLGALTFVLGSLYGPIFLFASSQYNLLTYLLLSTFRPGILCKQTKIALIYRKIYMHFINDVTSF